MADIGQKVRVHYVGTLDDGTEFDNSYKRGEPIDFTVGAGQMIPGFDRAVFQMEQGERRTVRLKPAEAYGEWRGDFVEQIPCSMMPNWEQMPVGHPIVLRTADGQQIQVTCIKVKDGIMHLDHNHPLAGKALTFEIELVEVVRESAIEREKHGSGCACGCHEFKDAITRQNAEAAERRRAQERGCGHDHHDGNCGCSGNHGPEHGHDCGCGGDHGHRSHH